MELSRKQFVTGAAAATALAGAASIAQADESRPDWMPEKWDRECDVVVVGTGSIIVAALRADALGLNVLVLEKHPTWFGGTTAFSGGGMSCPNSTQALALGNREIPRDMLKDYMMEVAEGQSSEELIDMMLDNYAPAVDFMNDECGYTWGAFPPAEEGQSWSFYYPLHPVTHEYKDVPTFVSIGMHEPTGTVMGRAIVNYGKDAVDARGIEVLMGTPATKLIYSGNPMLGNGEVIGVWAETPEGEPIAIKARYGVILGTGGFDHNREMMANYINHPIYSTPAIPTNTGDGHIMAMEVGANMKSMDEVFNHTVNMMGHPDLYESVDLALEDGSYCCEQRNKAWATIGCTGSIMVNRRGQRFCCEGSSYDLLGRAFDAYDNSTRDWLNIPGYLVFDGTYAGAFGFGAPTLAQLLKEEELPSWIHAFDTMEELADGMGIDQENLLATVARWNEMCKDGVDLDWHRGEEVWDRYTCGDASRVESGELKNPCMAPLNNGPFYCIEVYPSLLTTSGGMEINGNAQVKNVRGEVIPRLYAGSNCIASPTGRGYALSGTANANGFVVGYVAANHIATLEPWE